MTTARARHSALPPAAKPPVPSSRPGRAPTALRVIELPSWHLEEAAEEASPVSGPRRRPSGVRLREEHGLEAGEHWDERWSHEAGTEHQKPVGSYMMVRRPASVTPPPSSSRSVPPPSSPEPRRPSMPPVAEGPVQEPRRAEELGLERVDVVLDAVNSLVAAGRETAAQAVLLDELFRRPGHPDLTARLRELRANRR